MTRPSQPSSASSVSRSRIHSATRLVGYNVLIAAVLLIPIEIGLRLFGSEFVLTPPRVEFGYPRPEHFGRWFLVDSDLLWVPHGYADRVAAAADWRPSVVFMGDSCSQSGRYASELRSIIKTRNPDAVFPFLAVGVEGWSSWSGLQQLQRDVLPMKPKAITMYFGWNDHWKRVGFQDKDAARFLKKSSDLRIVELADRAVFALMQLFREPGPYRVSLPDFRANLRSMVRIARDHDIIPILLTAPTSHRRGREPAYLALHYLNDLDDLVPLHRRYVQAVRDVAAEEDAPLVDLHHEFSQLPRHELERFFSSDGIHLTPEGDRKIAEIVDGELVRMGLDQRLVGGARSILEERLQETLDRARLVANDRFDIWLDGDRLLYYVKDHCGTAEKPFFLDIVPVDPNDLPEPRKEHGTEHRAFDISYGNYGNTHARLDFMPRCVAMQPLPDYAVATVRTGQTDGGERSWEVEFHLEDDVAAGSD